MLKHIGLAAVAVALVTLTADTVHGRGGMRGHSSFRYNFGSGGFSAGYYYPSGGRTVSSHYRGSFGTSRSSSRKSANTAGNTLSSGGTSSTSTGATASVTRRGTMTMTGGSNTSTTQQTAASTPATSSPTTASSQTTTQSSIAGLPLGMTSALSYPLTQDPNTAAERMYRGLLSNAKQLIRAGVYPPAINDLQRIINGAPGTRIAGEAQRLLARLQTN
jgi:hypothetical protein